MNVAYTFIPKKNPAPDRHLVNSQNISSFKYISHIKSLTAYILTMKHKRTAGREKCSPKCRFSVKGRTCNTSPLVHKDMSKKPRFMKKVRRDNSSRI